jgi:hypothetical protein
MFSIGNFSRFSFSNRESSLIHPGTHVPGSGFGNPAVDGSAKRAFSAKMQEDCDFLRLSAVLFPRTFSVARASLPV